MIFPSAYLFLPVVRSPRRIQWQFLDNKYTLVSCKRDVSVSCPLEWFDVVIKDVMMPDISYRIVFGSACGTIFLFGGSRCGTMRNLTPLRKVRKFSADFRTRSDFYVAKNRELFIPEKESCEF